MIFKFKIYDTLWLPFNTPLEDSYPLFVPSREGQSKNITTYSESELIRMFLSHNGTPELLLEELGITSPHDILLNVEEPVVRRGILPGDIDIIIHSSHSRKHSIGIEGKVIHVTAKNPEEDKRNKMQKISTGIHQSNSLFENHRFHQTYLMVISAVDGVERVENSTFFSMSSDETLKLILNHIWEGKNKLRDEVGVLLVEVVQPTRRSTEEQGMIGIAVVRAATPQDQGQQLTNRIDELYTTDKASNYFLQR